MGIRKEQKIAIGNSDRCVNKVHNSVNKITKLEVHKTCEKIGITPPENGNRNGPDLVQAFQKKRWVESRFYSAQDISLL